MLYITLERLNYTILSLRVGSLINEVVQHDLVVELYHMEAIATI